MRPVSCFAKLACSDGFIIPMTLSLFPEEAPFDPESREFFFQGAPLNYIVVLLHFIGMGKPSKEYGGC